MSSDRCINEAWQLLRDLIIHRDGGKCKVCSHKAEGYIQDENIPTYHYEVHHIMEKENGGDDSSNNLVTLCCECHSDIHNKGYTKRKARSRLKKAILKE